MLPMRPASSTKRRSGARLGHPTIWRCFFVVVLYLLPDGGLGSGEFLWHSITLEFAKLFGEVRTRLLSSISKDCIMGLYIQKSSGM